MSLTADFSHNSKRSGIKKQYQPIFPLEYSPIYGPYAPITNLEASLQRNFINILLTSPGEWPMNPDLGVGLKTYLFENYNSPKMSELRPSIVKQVDRYLPNIQIHKIDLQASEAEQDSHQVSIIISYILLGNQYISTRFALDEAMKVKNMDIERTVIASQASESLNSNLKSNMVTI